MQSDICTIRKPENAAGIWLLEIEIVLTINAVLPHTVQTTRILTHCSMDNNIIRAFLVNHFLIFPHHLSEDHPFN